MRKSVKKQQSQVRKIQRTVTSRNVTQINSNINNFWKGSRWFCRHCLKAFVISYNQNQENGCLENYICVRVFKHRPIPNDQTFCTRHMLCLCQSRQFQLTALPGQTMQRVQNTKSIISLTCSFKHAHICINTNTKALCLKRNSMTSSMKFTFDVLTLAANSRFFIFALTISSDESQSKAQINLQSLGVNKTGYCAENIEFFPHI